MVDNYMIRMTVAMIISLEVIMILGNGRNDILVK